MLRPLAILAGLVLLALVVAISLGRETQEHATPAPEPTPSLDGSSAAQESLSATEAGRHDEAGEVVAPDARYVGIVGELTREEDGALVDNGVVTFGYRYVSKGPDANVRKVAVDIDEHGHFEQLFSEPVQLVNCDAKPAQIEHTDGLYWHDALEFAAFVPVHRELGRLVDSRDIRVDLSVSSGLELCGKVFDEKTNAPVVQALVWVQVDVDRAVGTFTRSNGTYRMRGFVPELSAPDRDFVAFHALGHGASVVREFELHARADHYGPRNVEIPLPLSGGKFGFVEIPMTPGFRVSGRVLDSDGMPMNGAMVTVRTQAQERNEDRECPRGWTDARGEFVLNGVTALDGAELRVRHPWQRGPSARIDLGVLQEDREGLELRLPESRCYRVELRDPTGEPLGWGYTMRVRNSSGEHCIENFQARLYLPIGERSDVLVDYDSGSSFRPVVLHGKATIEPLAKREEPETLVIELQP